MRLNKYLVTSVVGLCALLIAPGPAWTQTTITWTNAAGTQDFDVAGNWDPNQVPSGTNDLALFNAAGTYQVDFNQNESNGVLVVDGGNVTFNLNGFTYDAGLSTNGTGPYSQTVMITNGATLTVTGGGTLNTQKLGSYDYGLTIDTGCSLIVTGGSQVVDRQIALAYQYSGFRFQRGSSAIVDGAGSELHNYGYYNQINGDILVENGGLFWDHRNVQTDNAFGGVSNATIVVKDPGSVLRVGGQLRSNYGGTLNITVTNGAEAWLANIEMTGGNLNFPENQLTVGGAGAASLVVVSNEMRLGVGWDLWSGAGHLNVHSNGTVRVIATGTYSNRAIRVGDAYIGPDPASSLNLDGGTLQINTNKMIEIEGDGFGHTPDGHTPTLRGAGTISKYNSGANFSIVNSGIIRPGDLGISTNNIEGIGVLNIVGGDLYQTNAAAGAQMFFEFSDSGMDQIVLDGGLAMITTGTNWFNLASGSAVPTPGSSFGLGSYDFIVGSNVTYAPQYDNLISNLAVLGLTQNVDYQWGIAYLADGTQALRLQFVPEPSTVLLLLGGGLLLFRLRQGYGG